MPRVLILCEYPSLNGGENSLLAMLAGPIAAGFQLQAAAPPRGPLALAFLQAGVPVAPLELHVGGRREPLEIARTAVRKAISAGRPDLVHANSLSMARLAGPVAAEAGIPSLGHLRDMLRLSRQAIMDLACNTRLLAVSRATRQWHVDQGLPAERTHVLHNGVDLQRFRPRDPSGYLHRELGLPREARLIAAIGQIGMRKGLDTWLTAAEQIARASSQDHFLLVGERHSQKAEALEYEAQLLERSRLPPLAGRVHFLGRRNDVPDLLGELAVLAHAARQEPLGRVLLEAAACGTPVVATGVGGTKEIFPPECGGAIVVPPDDPSALARGALILLEDGAFCRDIRFAARRRAERAFDARAAGAMLARHYAEALAAGSAASVG